MHPNAHFRRRNIVLYDRVSVCRGGILSGSTGYQFAGEEYCLARPDIRLPNSRHVETVVLLSKKQSEYQRYIEIGFDADEYYRIKDK